MKHTDPPPPPSPKASARQGPEAQAGHGPGASHHHYSQAELHNEDVAHEHSDINVRAIVISAVTLAAVTAVVFVLMWGAFRILDEQARQHDPEVSPLAAQPTEMPSQQSDIPAFGNAPTPQLLTNEYAVLEQHRTYEIEQLQGYGWVNEAAGVARLPIAEAKKLLLNRGLPARERAAPPALGTNRPSSADASSGRTAHVK
jgi:hypothetical protein